MRKRTNKNKKDTEPLIKNDYLLLFHCCSYNHYFDFTKAYLQWYFPTSSSHLNFHDAFYILVNFKILLMISFLCLLILMHLNCSFNIFLQIFNFFIYSFNYYFFHLFSFIMLIKSFKSDFLKSITTEFKFYHCIWFCMLLEFYDTFTCLFSPEKGSYYV